MNNFTVRLCEGLKDAALYSPLKGLCGVIGGAVYGKLADLPAGQVAKAWAVWFAAETAFATLATAFTDNRLIKASIAVTVNLLGGALAIHELQKRELIGKKMTIFIVIVKILCAVGMLINATKPEQTGAPAAAGPRQ